jgi:hypothetical protein
MSRLMRTLVLAAVFAALSASATSANQPLAQQYRDYSCLSFIKDRMGEKQVEVGEAVADYVSERGGFTDYVSYCTTVENVRAECALDHTITVGTAIERLYIKRSQGRALPLRKACGA